MLRDLVERYLGNLKKERSFDSMFLGLLAAEGYTDVHLIHGGLEFGKDFIAKKGSGDEHVQYAFQNKVGKVGAAEWREIRHQMLETLTNDIGGPSFDVTLPRNSALVLTGRLVGTAPADCQQFIETIKKQLTGRQVLPPWDREVLIELLLKHGPEQLFRTGADIATYGAFYRLYGDIIERQAKVDDMERHFDRRLRAVASPLDRLAAVAIEAHLLADAARTTDQPHVVLQAMLAVVRSIAYEIQSHGATTAELSAMLHSAEADVFDAAEALSTTYVDRAKIASGLYEAAGGAALIVTYPILCSHVMDALVLQYFSGTDDQAIAATTKLATFVSSEQGCAHPISDRYAVSVVWAIRVLHETGHTGEARALLNEAAVWLVDRYWQGGFGLAPCDAQEDEEVAQLLGGPFKGIDVKRQSGSLLACALIDAAALLQDDVLFEGLRADLLAADIVPRYYQMRDTTGQFEYSAEDIVRFPNVEFSEHLTAFDELAHGNHLDGEPIPRLEQSLGNAVYAAVSLLMRDRYFPQTWLTRRLTTTHVDPISETSRPASTVSATAPCT